MFPAYNLLEYTNSRVLANNSLLCYNYCMFDKIKTVIGGMMLCVLLCTSCSAHKTKTAVQSANSKEYISMQEQLQQLLQNEKMSDETRYAIVNRIANNMLSVKDYNSLILFLTGWVDKHPDDMYNSYWLLMTAYAYLENNAEPVAEYYFERIIKNYSDLMVQGKSVHFLCLQHLIQISTSPSNP